METLNKCILNYRQPKSAAFVDVLGNLKGWGGDVGKACGGGGGGGTGRPGDGELRRFKEAFSNPVA